MVDRFNILKIVPITVCVKYSDYLLISLAINRDFFEEYVVVTVPEDVDTHAVCNKYNCHILLSDSLQRNGAVFNKSALINFAQNYVHKKFPEAWVLLLDSDILIPDNFKEIVEEQLDDRTALYSMPRFDFLPDELNVMHIEQLKIFEQSQRYRTDFMGFFQLYFNKDQYYPNDSYSCRDCDSIFASSFQRLRMMSIFSYLRHIGQGNMNHFGRCTESLKIAP